MSKSSAFILLLFFAQCTFEIECTFPFSSTAQKQLPERLLTCIIDYIPKGPFPRTYSLSITGAKAITNSEVYIDGIPTQVDNRKSAQEFHFQFASPPKQNQRNHHVDIPIILEKDATSIGVTWQLNTGQIQNQNSKALSFFTLSKDYAVEANCESGTISVLIYSPNSLMKNSALIIALPKGLSVSPQIKGNCMLYSSIINSPDSIECEAGASYIRLYLIEPSFSIIRSENASMKFLLKTLSCITYGLGSDLFLIHLAHENYSNKPQLDDAPPESNLMSIECPLGYFEIDNNNCEKCSVNCLECLWYTICSSCVEGSTFDNDQCISNQICPLGTFGTPNGCIACPIGCTHCLSEYFCTECNDTHILFYDLCAYTCPIGQFAPMISASGICEDCPLGCNDCRRLNDCTNCSGNYTLESGICYYNPCPDGQYDDSSADEINCKSCPSHCLKCINNSSCFRCEESLIYNYDYAACVLNCPQGEYFVSDNNGEHCDACPPTCEGCRDFTNCYSCKQNYQLYGGMCQLICPHGQYPNIDENCVDCPDNCTECWSEFDCSECNSTHQLFNGRCIINCPEGTYDDLSTDEILCVNCSEFCLLCYDNQSCALCDENHILSFHQNCIMKCPDGKYDNPYDAVYECERCPIQCTKCESYSQCTECHANHTLIFYGKCLFDCPAGQFGVTDMEGDYCLECPHRCATCNSFTECLSCNTNYSLNKNECLIDCPEGQVGVIIEDQDKCIIAPHCKNASFSRDIMSYYYCNECEDGYTNIFSKCILKCQQGFYDDPETEEEKCLPCSQHCSSCSRNYCVTCEDDYSLLDYKCVKKCEHGKFGAIRNQQDVCLDCSVNCLECTGTFSCTECKEGYYQIAGKCSVLCPQRMYDDLTTLQNVCLNCTAHCAICNTDIYCYECEEGYEPRLNNCIRIETNNITDPAYCYEKTGTLGLYWNGTACNNCSINCNKCYNDTSCMSCKRSYYLNENICTESCPMGYFKYEYLSYYDETIRMCLKCPYGCKSCSSDFDCSECINSEFKLVDRQCKCSENICKTNCLPSEDGCSLCGTHMVYVKKNDSCSICNLWKKQDYSDFDRSMLVYQVCTGILGYRDPFRNRYKELGEGISGIGNDVNNICSIGKPTGPIPPGLYKFKKDSCSFKGNQVSKIIQLEPITKFSNDSLYHQLFSSLYLYPFGILNYLSDFVDGQNGIALPDQVINSFSMGDTIEATIEGCADYLNACNDGTLPPPTTGTVNITTTSKTNELRINFINWGETAEIDMLKFEYSASLYSGSIFIELCEGNDVNEFGLLCNANNNKRLGFFKSNGTFPLRIRVRYINHNLSAMWASLNVSMDILPISTSESTTEVISKNLTAANASDLINQLNYRKQALDEIIKPTQIPLAVAECPKDFCQNNGVCSLSQNRPRCKCSSSFSGSTCQIEKTLLQLAIKQSEQAASNLLTMVATTDAATVINVVSIITSNTDLVSLTAIKDIIKSINTIMSSNSASGSIDYLSLREVRTNLMSAAIKNIVTAKTTTLRLLDSTNALATNDTDIIDQLGSLNLIFRNYINLNFDIISKNENVIIEDIEGQMNTYYFPSKLGNITMEKVIAGSLDSKSIVTSMLYPQEVSMLFPFPAKSNIGSNIISITSQVAGSPNSIKSIKFATFSLNAQIGTLIGKVTYICGYYDEVSFDFNNSGCNTSVKADKSIECACETTNSNIYVVESNKKASNKILIIAIVVPISVCIIVAAAVSIVYCLKKKMPITRRANAYAATDNTNLSIIATTKK